MVLRLIRLVGLFGYLVVTRLVSRVSTGFFKLPRFLGWYASRVYIFVVSGDKVQ